MKYSNKLISILFVLIFYNIPTFSNSYTDSLLNVAKYSNSDKEKANLYIKIIRTSKDYLKNIEYSDSVFFYLKKYRDDTLLMLANGFRGMAYGSLKQFDKSNIYCLRASVIGEKLGKTKDVAAMYKYIAKNYDYTYSYDSSIYYLDKAITKYKELLQEGSVSKEFCYKKLGYCKAQMGKQLLRQGQYDKSLDYMYDGLRDYDQINDYRGQAKIHNNIGNIYNFNQDYENAYLEYKKTIRLAEKAGKVKSFKMVLTNIGVIFLNKNEYDSALYYFNKSLQIYTFKKKNYNSISGLYNNIGLIFKKQKQYDSALVYFNRSIDLLKEINNEIGVVKAKANIGITYIEMKRYTSAKKILLEALKYSKSNKMGETTKEIYLGLSVIAKETNDYKNALRYNNLYVEYKDSINSIEVTKKISEYREQYEAEKKDRKIQDLQKKAQLQELIQENQKVKNRRQVYINYSLLILALLLLIIIFSIYRYFKLKSDANRELIKKQEQINQQKVIDLVKSSEVNSINSYMEGQEKERTRIAAELHDRLGSLLSTVKLHFSSFEAANEENIKDKETFNFALDLLDNSVEEVRSISHNLSKGILTQFGLQAAVENLRDQINAAGSIQVKLIKAGPEYNINPESEIELFRVIQELITNAIKHSQSKEIYIQLISDDEGLNVIVEDYGVGFNIDKLKSKGIGIQNLKTRIEKIGGTYHLESTVGKGTSIIIELKNSKQ
jgi:signal transduction histidine kinase